MGGVGDGGGRVGDRSLLGNWRTIVLDLGRRGFLYGVLDLFLWFVLVFVEIDQRCIRVYKGCVLWSRHICLYSKLRPPRLLLWRGISLTVFVWH